MCIFIDGASNNAAESIAAAAAAKAAGINISIIAIGSGVNFTELLQISNETWYADTFADAAHAALKIKAGFCYQDPPGVLIRFKYSETWELGTPKGL